MKRFLFTSAFVALVAVMVFPVWVLAPKTTVKPTVTFLRYEVAEVGLCAVFRMKNESTADFEFQGKNATKPTHEYLSSLTYELNNEFQRTCGMGIPHLSKGEEVEFRVQPLDRMGFRVRLNFWKNDAHNPCWRKTPSLQTQAEFWLREKLDLWTGWEEFVVISDFAPPPPTIQTHPWLFQAPVHSAELGQSGIVEFESTKRMKDASPFGQLAWDPTTGILSLKIRDLDQ